jgi:hypothetical protein|tara:strand:+ start:563 stop:757 length:195 start_codon:yes stop_codon:yes gene_type:complete
MTLKKDADKVAEPTAVYAAASSHAGETVERIRAGLPMVEFIELQELLGLGAEELAPRSMRAAHG